jgi:hypothetical protein
MNFFKKLEVTFQKGEMIPLKHCSTSILKYTEVKSMRIYILLPWNGYYIADFHWNLRK